MAQSKPLREALKARFYPWVESRGFARGKSTWLFTVFRRRDGANLSVFEVQWDKYRRSCFVVNFGEITRQALAANEGEVEIWQCNTLGRLQPKNCPYLRCWFRLRKPWLEAIRSRRLLYEPDEVVDQLIALFPEVEDWWAAKREGPHLRFSTRAG